MNIIEFQCQRPKDALHPDGCKEILKYKGMFRPPPGRNRKACNLCGYQHDISKEMFASLAIQSTGSKITSGKISNQARPSKKARKGNPKPSIMVQRGAESHCDNGSPGSEITQENIQSGLDSSSHMAASSSNEGTGSNYTGRDVISGDDFDAIWLKRPIEYLLKKSREKFGWDSVCESQWSLLSRLTDPNNIMNKGVPKMPTQLEITHDMLYDVVPPNYLGRLVKDWLRKGYIFKKESKFVANREYFDWGLWPDKEPAPPVEIPKASNHKDECWLTVKGFTNVWELYYGSLGPTTIGARNFGEKKVVLGKLRLFGINAMGIKDYTVYAYRKKGIKFNIYPGPYASLEELEKQRVVLQRTIQNIMEEEVKARTHEDIAFTVEKGFGSPHVTLPIDGKVILSTPDGTTKAFNPDGSDPGQSESQDLDAPETVDFDHKLKDRVARQGQDICDLKKDSNRMMGMMEYLNQVPVILQKMVDNQVLAANASNEAAKLSYESNKRHSEELEGVKDTMAQLTNQIGSLVQALLNQQGAGASY